MTYPTDFRGDAYGFVAIVIAQGYRAGFVTDLHPTREEAARKAFDRCPTLRTVMTERRYVGKPCGGDIQWIARRDLLPPLTAADVAARARSIPGSHSV